MRYPYARRNLLQESESYMYPPFLGWDFVIAYRAARISRAQKLETHLAKAECASPLLHVLGHDTRAPLLPAPDDPALILALDGLDAGQRTAPCSCTFDFLRIMATEPLTEASAQNRDHLLGLIRRFEVSKKLPHTLLAPRYPLRGTPETDAPSYALFASLLGRLHALDNDLRTLNCLLKLCDLVCSLPVQALHPPLSAGHAVLGLRYELAAMAKLFGDDDGDPA
ncbi:hypothetical protein [Desulfocurvus sp. DL9XJH121]